MSTARKLMTLGALLLVCHARARAEQFVLFDEVCTFPATNHGGGAAFFKWVPGPECPASWAAPVNFRDGALHTHYEVLEKTEPGEWTVGLNWFSPSHGLKHIVGRRFPNVTVGQVYECRETPGGMPDNLDGPWDWTHAVKDGFVCVGEKRRKYRHHWEKGADKSLPLYKNMKSITIHAMAVVVSEGGTYTPVESWKPLPWHLKELKDVAELIRQEKLGPALAAAEKVSLQAASPAAAAGPSGEKDEKGERNAKRAAEAKKVVDLLGRALEQRRRASLGLKARDPVAAMERMLKLAEKYAPSSRAADLRREAMSWKKEPAVQKALRARVYLERIEKMADSLRKKLKGKPATDPGVQRRFGRELVTLRKGILLLSRSYSETASAARARAIADELGIPIPE